jgi:organic radical activating enzyme
MAELLFNSLKKQINTILPNNDMSGIKLRDCKWTVRTAGPSPYNNERTELFFFGCEKALSGNPCKGCFNVSTWNGNNAQFSHDPVLMAKHINNNAPNKYITIGGGEPTDQLYNLIILCKELKKYEFNIMVYTWKNLKQLITIPTNVFEEELSIYKQVQQYRELLNYVDIVVDGEYIEEERLWDGSREDGLLSSIGSGNQIVWDIPNRKGFYMRDIDSLSIINDKLITVLKNQDAEIHTLDI